VTENYGILIFAKSLQQNRFYLSPDDASTAMKIDDPKILSLRAKARAAHEEFDTAQACHEAWKPAAYDEALHERIGRSFAANTFIVLRQALRREMLLALMRLWDNNSQAVGMKSIANSLQDKRIMDARRIEAKFGREQSDALRQRATEAIAIIDTYTDGGSRYSTYKKLKRLRGEHLAHRQVTPTPAEVVGADTTDEEIENFYQDMSRLIRLLRGSVEDTDYNPEETAKLRHRHAALFWAGVRGERTEGHPDYEPPRLAPRHRSEG
jgi:hypothetical protein